MTKKLLSQSLCALFLGGAAGVLTPDSAQAQSGPQKGYIVPLSGDTLRGTVVVGRAQRNAQMCEFQAAGQPTAKQYQPTELRGYGTEMLAYESQIVPRVADSVGVATMPVFLEVLTRGPLTLYGLSSASKERYFLGGYRPGKLVELLQRQTQMQQNGKQYLVKQPLYQDTLARAFQSCPDQAKRVTQYIFQAQQLEKAVRNYNACAAPQQIVKQSARRGSFGFGVVVGTGVSDKLILGADDGSSIYNYSYGGKSYFTGGLEVVLTPGYKGAPFTIHSGLFYERNRSFSAALLNPQFGTETVTLKVNYILFPIMLRYSFGHGLLRPYIEAGASVRFTAGVDEDNVDFVSTRSGMNSSKYPFLGSYRESNYGFGAGAGVELYNSNKHRLSLGARAEQTGGPVVQGSTLNTVKILLGYTFSK